MKPDNSIPDAYFVRTGEDRFTPTSLVSGAWNAEEQHVAPSLGLLSHHIERNHRLRHKVPLQLSRISFDIFGVMPLTEMKVSGRVIRPGRTIELVEGELRCAGRTVLLARAWFLQQSNTRTLAGSGVQPLAPPEAMAPWSYADLWGGAFVRSVDVRRASLGTGKAAGWIRTAHELVRGEQVSDTSRLIGLLDLANGLAPRVGPDLAAFPNVDLTAHLFAKPRGEWLGLETTSSIGPGGSGLTQSTIFDLTGPIGTLAQSLTIRPR